MLASKVSAVEENLFAWRRVFLDVEGVVDRSEPDVHATSSAVPSPVFNGVCAARFEDWATRGEEVSTAFVGRGLPWFWLVTPSTTSAELEALFDDLGMVRNETPGMYLDLVGWEPEPALPGLDLAVVGPDHPAVVDTLVPAFGLSDWLREPLRTHASAFARNDSFAVLGSWDSRPVAGGLGLMTGSTLGLYFITTHSDLRGRGIGHAVTEALLGEGKRRGATNAVLHSSAMGRPVYDRIGFTEVCRTTQYLWQPTVS